MNKIKDLTGKRIGMLRVLKINGKTKQGNTTFLCECDCGEIFTVSGGNLSRKNSTYSCGCFRHNIVDSNRKARKCARCHHIKAITKFPPNKSRKDGHSQYCVLCKREVDKLYNKKYQKYKTRYVKLKRNTDLSFRIADNLRRRINCALNGSKKTNHTVRLLGCSIEYLKYYLESKFTAGMTWENYGTNGWHIDHIIPCDSFDLTVKENQEKCFHFTNLQPLWAFDNLSKGNKIL